MPILLYTTLLFFFAAALFLLLFIKMRQKARKFELSNFIQKFEIFKEKAHTIGTISEGANIINQYKNLVSKDFAKNHPLEGVIVATITGKIVAAHNPNQLRVIIGECGSPCEKLLWSKVIFEVLPHLKALSEKGPTSQWLNDLVS